MKPEHADRIEALLAAGSVRDAIAAVAEFPDLRHADLPPISKGTFVALAKSPDAVGAFAEGLMSVSPSVRRFAKKVVPKLGDVGGLLLTHVVDALDPFRPGAFGGFASPVGRAIVDDTMSLAVREPAVYSEAARYAREALGMTVGALAASDVALVPVLYELVEGLVRAGLTSIAVPATPAFADARDVSVLAIQLRGAVSDAIEEVWWPHAKKGQPALVDAALAWTRGETFAADARFDGVPAVVALRPRFDEPAWTTADYRGAMRYRGSEQLRVLPTEPRVRLRATIAEVLPGLTDEQSRWVKRAIDEHDRLYPGETAVAVPPVVSKAPTAPVPFGVEAPTEAPTPELALDALDSLERVLGRDAAAVALRDAGLDAKPVLAAACDAIGASDSKHGTEAALAEASWTGPLFDLLVAGARPFAATLRERRESGGIPDPSVDYEGARDFHLAVLAALEALAVAAGLLLPAQRLDAWAAFWDAEVGTYDGFSDVWWAIGEVREARGVPAAVAYFRSWLEAGPRQPNGNAYWQSIVSHFYRRPEPESHALAREAVAAVPLPTGSEYYKRQHWNAPYQWTIRAAWERRDAAMLAAACERCALPVYRKGERAFVPLVDTYREDANYAPSTRETERSVAVDEVWSLVRAEKPERVPTILANLLRVAEFEEPARAILRAASEADATALGPFAADVVELTESSEPSVAGLGLAIAERLGDALGDRAEAAVASAARWSASTSSAAAKAAVSALGAFAARPDALGETAAQALCEALYVETPAVLESVLKALKGVAPERVGDGARARVRELAASDPKRFGKLATALGER